MTQTSKTGERLLLAPKGGVPTSSNRLYTVSQSCSMRMFCAGTTEEDLGTERIAEENINPEYSYCTARDVESIVRKEMQRSDLETLLKKETGNTERKIEITSIHQISLFYWLPLEGHEKSWTVRMSFFLLSYILVIFQCMIVTALLAPSMRPPCFESESCHSGQWCKRDGALCQPCLQRIKEICDKGDADAFTEKYSKNSFNAEDYISACSACYRGEDDALEEFVTEYEVIGENLKIMQFFDWVALLVTTVVVAASLATEMNDVWITRFIVKRLRLRSKSGRLARLWHLLIVLRMHVLLPLMISAVPMITAYLGGDALNV